MSLSFRGRINFCNLKVFCQPTFQSGLQDPLGINAAGSRPIDLDAIFAMYRFRLPNFRRRDEQSLQIDQGRTGPVVTVLSKNPWHASGGYPSGSELGNLHQSQWGVLVHRTEKVSAAGGLVEPKEVLPGHGCLCPGHGGVSVGGFRPRYNRDRSSLSEGTSYDAQTAGQKGAWTPDWSTIGWHENHASRGRRFRRAFYTGLHDNRPDQCLRRRQGDAPHQTGYQPLNG